MAPKMIVTYLENQNPLVLKKDTIAAQKQIDFKMIEY
jgi:hypothetical protein